MAKNQKYPQFVKKALISDNMDRDISAVRDYGILLCHDFFQNTLVLVLFG
jgi:hypothetical protein